MSHCHNCKNEAYKNGAHGPCATCENGSNHAGATSPASALDVQVAGSHYKDMAIQPIEFIHLNGLGFLEGCVVKRIARWRKKDGMQDLLKARHELDLLIEMESSK